MSIAKSLWRSRLENLIEFNIRAFSDSHQATKIEILEMLLKKLLRTRIRVKLILAF